MLYIKTEIKSKPKSTLNPSKSKIWFLWRIWGWLLKLRNKNKYGCPACGDERWLDIPFEHKDYFECTDSGEGNDTCVGHYYWWEGYKFCPRCGYKKWIHEESA